MPYLLNLILLCIIGVHGYSQETACIFGKIRTNELPLQGATIQVSEHNLGTISDSLGSFLLEGIPLGWQNIEVRLLGYQPYAKSIYLEPNKSYPIDIELQIDLLGLNEIVISGTRYEQNRYVSPVIVNVLNAELFNSIQAVTLADGLNFIPGIRVETNCQNCGFTQVRLNGLEGAYSQILVNSRPIFSSLTSVYGLEQIPSNIIERVEVVRGGGSALYGSNAIAGTINIITKQPTENNWQIASNTALINRESADLSINFNGTCVSNDLKHGITLYGMYRNRTSFDANDDGFSEITSLKNKTFGLKAFLKPGKRSKITLDFDAIKEFRRGGDRLNIAPHFTDITESLDHNIIISGLSFDQFSRDNRNKFSSYFSAQTTNRGSYYGGLGGGRTPSDSLRARNAYGLTSDLSTVLGFQFTRYIADRHVLILGLENLYSKVKDEIPGYKRIIDQKVNTSGLFGQFEWHPTNRIKTLLGARLDYTYVDGAYKLEDIFRESKVNAAVLSPRISILIDITESLQARFGYARGFRAPQAFNEDLHISSVGGKPQFVIIGESLVMESSNAFTTSLNFTRNFGKWQANFLAEGFYTTLQNPFTVVGSAIKDNSAVLEVQNGSGAYVAGYNFEFSLAPSGLISFQFGGTFQRSKYQEDQVLYFANSEAPVVVIDHFLRSPNSYGFFTTSWQVMEDLKIDFTGTYTGAMTIARRTTDAYVIELNQTDPFLDANIKSAYHFHVGEDFHLEFSCGVLNVFNCYQDDFEIGPYRDSDYIYGPMRPRTFFIGLKVGSFH